MDLWNSSSKQNIEPKQILTSTDYKAMKIELGLLILRIFLAWTSYEDNSDTSYHVSKSRGYFYSVMLLTELLNVDFCQFSDGSQTGNRTANLSVLELTILYWNVCKKTEIIITKPTKKL